MAHNRAPRLRVRPADPAGGLTGAPMPENITDGSVMLLERQIGQIPFYPNQERKLDLKLQPNLIKKLMLHVRGKAQPVIQVPPITQRINSRIGAYPLIKNIQIRASNGVILKSVGAQQLNMLNTLERGGNEFAITFYSAYSEMATHEFSFDLTIPFESWTSFIPERTMLNTNEFSEIGLYILWGSAEDIPLEELDETQLVISDVVCDVTALERVPVDMTDELLNRQRMVDTVQTRAISSNNETVSFDLPENTLIKTLLFYVEIKKRYTPEIPLVPLSPTLRGPLPNGILRARVEDDNGAHVIREMSGRQIQSINQSYYGMSDLTPREWADQIPELPHETDTFYGNQKPGIYALEFDQMHDFSTLYSTIGINYPKLILDCGILPGTPAEYTISYRVVLLQRQIITPASVTR